VKRGSANAGFGRVRGEEKGKGPQKVKDIYSHECFKNRLYSKRVGVGTGDPEEKDLKKMEAYNS